MYHEHLLECLGGVIVIPPFRRIVDQCAQADISPGQGIDQLPDADLGGKVGQQHLDILQRLILPLRAWPAAGDDHPETLSRKTLGTMQAYALSCSGNQNGLLIVHGAGGLVVDRMPHLSMFAPPGPAAGCRFGHTMRPVILPRGRRCVWQYSVVQCSARPIFSRMRQPSVARRQGCRSVVSSRPRSMRCSMPAWMPFWCAVRPLAWVSCRKPSCRSTARCRHAFPCSPIFPSASLAWVIHPMAIPIARAVN